MSIITGTPPLAPDGACFLYILEGTLVVDPEYGVALDDGHGLPPVPVAWRPSFTARRDGAEVAVIDKNGNVVARTGHRYRIPGGYVGPDGFANSPTPLYWACNSVLQE